MKKNLLITLGDSWTQGFGCGLWAKGIKIRQSFSSDEEYQTYQTELRELENIYGWARVCANLLDYDLINLAKQAWSNPGLVKSVINDITHTSYRTTYNKVVFVYLLTDPYRFGLFTNSGIQHITFRGLQKSNSGLNFGDIKESRKRPEDSIINEHIWQAYIDYMIPEGVIQESVFSLNCMEHFCKSCGYEFYWGTAFTPYQDLLPYNINMNNCLHYNEFDSFKSMIFNKYKLQAFSACLHPNELGYEEIGKYIYNKLLI